MMKWFLFLSCGLAFLAGCKPPAQTLVSDDGSAAELDLSSKQGLEVAAQLKRFVGAPAKLVWSAHAKKGKADPFQVGKDQVLMALDTEDGRGVRQLFHDKGNYGRPLLNHDATVILYTEKNIKRDDQKRKKYRPEIYRTDWKGTQPVKIAEGYALDTWWDEQNQIEWVYVAQDLVTSTRIAIEAKRLMRFPLNAPEKIELVYADTAIGVDNVQFSRNGQRASSLFPWPHCGVLVKQGDTWSAEKLLTGCWPSLAPDNSGVSWVFDGEHRNAVTFSPDGQQWKIALNTAPAMDRAEVYHPRWSNHAQFLALTGPYVKAKGTTGSVIGKGGVSAEVFIGKLNETATEVTEWLQISDDEVGDSFPDLWVQGGEHSRVKLKAPTANVETVKAPQWPTSKQGALLMWKDRSALNVFTNSEQEKVETRVESLYAARYGRYGEMLGGLNSGWFELSESNASALNAQVASQKDFTWEAVLVPNSVPQDGAIWKSSTFALTYESGQWIIADQQQTIAVPANLTQVPLHLVIQRQSQQWKIWQDGIELKSATHAPLVLKDEPKVQILSGWNGGLLQLAVWDHALNEEVLMQHVQASKAWVQTLPATPPQVRLKAKLVELSAMPTAEGIDPYTGSLIAYVYEVEQVLAGEFTGKQVLVKHWGMLGKLPVQDFPREIGKSYELLLESETHHPQLQGERVMDDTLGSLELEPWVDVSQPKVQMAQ